MASQPPAAGEVQRIFPNEAESLIRRGQAIAVDVRSPEAYAAGHIAGALSIPLASLTPGLTRVPKEPALIFYCT